MQYSLPVFNCQPHRFSPLHFLPSSIPAVSFAAYLGSHRISIRKYSCILLVSFHASSNLHTSTPYVILDSQNISYICTFLISKFHIKSCNWTFFSTS
jgi:hypothetical protein